MKILIVNTNENQGGAAKAALRLYKCLDNNKIDIYYLVDNKISDDYKVIELSGKFEKIKKVLKQQLDKFSLRRYKNRTGVLFSPNNNFLTGSIIKKIIEVNPDIVHLHWINDGMINIKDLLKINKPIVWTMHDSWLFTGGCHLPYECDKYLKECSRCPALGSNKENDLSKKIFNIKLDIFDKVNLNIVAPSNWMANNSKKSMLLKDKSISIIPNPINTNFYTPIDKDIAREILRLQKRKKIILFSASSDITNTNKGFNQLSDSLKKINLKNIILIIVGSSKPKKLLGINCPIYYFGKLNDDISMNIVYNCADVVVVPSLSENLSNTIMESLACGTPVVAFNIGGNKDMIVHKENGYVAKQFDTTDLSNGIKWILNSSNYNELCQNAREKVLREFDSRVIARKYIELYEEILKV